MDFTFIETTRDLQQAYEEWKSETQLAIDVEAENNLHHYGTKLAIIQVSSGSRNWIVDALKIRNLSQIKSLMENPSIMKIFHDISFDIRILNANIKMRPRNIFDTSIAAQLLGYKKVGLSELLKKFYGVQKSEKFQKADWTRRPISKEMLDYAVTDTKYLIGVKDRLSTELRNMGRYDWAIEEFRALEKAKIEEPENNYYDLKGAGKLNPRSLGVLREIFNFRESLARKLDKPVYFVINNKLLLDLAQNPPRSEKEWQSMRGVHPEVRKQSKKFQEAVQRGLSFPAESHQKKGKFKRLTKAQERRYDELNDIRTKIAAELGIDSHWILDKQEMINLSTGGSITDLKRWQQKVILAQLTG